ncbi:MAG: YfiR family protein [Cytophagales bacterium]|nr:YfiR family protein [Cytophagales bacterium]
MSSCVGGKKFESLQKDYEVVQRRNKVLETKLDSVVDVTERQKREIRVLNDQLVIEKGKAAAYNQQAREVSVSKNNSSKSSLSRDDEYNQKANFILNFGKFIFWPRDYMTDKDFVIGVYGKSPITEKLLEITSGKTINGKRITVQSIEVGKPIENVHIVFFPDQANAGISGLVAKIKKSPILVITERLESTNKNYMLNFLDTEDKVKFSLNRQNANNAGLNVNLDLMKLSF